MTSLKYQTIFYLVSDIEGYFEYIIKKHKKLKTIPAIYVYINRVNNRFEFEIKHGYKVELQTPETMKLFCSTKKLIGKKKRNQVLKYLK